MNMKWKLTALAAALALAGCSQKTPVAEAPAQEHNHETTEKDAHEHEAAGAHTHATKLAFSAEPGGIPVGQPTTWTLKVSDVNSGEPINDFEIEMSKLMHLIVVKKDLSWFNHIHPDYKGNGTFTVTTTLPSAGSYKLYADYTPKGKGQEVPQYEFVTAGHQPVPTNALPSADKVGANGWMVKPVTSHLEGQPAMNGGTTYQVALMPMPGKLIAGQDAMLHFQVRDEKGQPIKDLQPYLGAMGHCVVLSSDTNTYLHSHPMDGGNMAGMKHDMDGMKMGDMDHKAHATPRSGGPDVIFHTNFPKAGLYKAWGQFRHKDKIITAAFVLNVVGGTATQNATQGDKGSTPVAQGVVYTCTMHPEVQSKQPGKCPKCGMTLVKKS